MSTSTSTQATSTQATPEQAVPTTPAYLEALAPIVQQVVAPRAAEVDAGDHYPAEALDVLGKAGLLGLISAEEVGGMGEGHRAATLVVEELARHCASTAMVVLMHYAATAVIEAFGDEKVRHQIAAGDYVTTLAFSEVGSRSMFWVPMSTATADGDKVRLDARKSWVTSAGQADGYVWSSKPVDAEGTSTIWLVPADAPGLTVGPPFDGLGLRGNESRPMTADGVTLPRSAMLGVDGGGFDIMLGLVLPYFQVMSAGFSVGTADAATLKTAAHAGSTRFEHLDQVLAENPVTRAYVARMRVKTDQAWSLLLDGLAALETGRADAILRVLEVKAAASEMATEVTDLAMRVCGGAAFRKEVGVERHFRDSRASTVMAPTTDALYDFIGRVICGLPPLLMDGEVLLGAVAYDPKVVTIWDGFRAWFAANDLAFDYVLYSNYERQVEDLMAGHVDVAWNSPLAWARAHRLGPVEAIAMRDTDCDLTSVVVVRSDSGIGSVADLGGRRVGVGAVDSPQATLIPLWHLAQSGAPDVEVVHHNVGAGKHGDHIGGERDAARALVAGDVDACCMIDGNHLAFSADGTLPAGATRVLTQTPAFDHCNFTVRAVTPALARFRDLLLSMSYDDPEVRPLLDLEGLKEWREGRTSGYGPLESAVAEQGFYSDDGTITAAGYQP